MYNIPTEGCNLEIMGYPFYVESVSPNEAFNRREYNRNNIVSGTMKVTPGAYVVRDFSITTHVFIDPNHPDEHNSIFQEMMSKPVEVISPEVGGRFNAEVVVKPERDSLNSLKLSISVKEIPDVKSNIPGESFTVPKSRDVEPEKTNDKDKKNNTKNKTNKNSKKDSNKNKTNTKTKTKTKKNKSDTKTK